MAVSVAVVLAIYWMLHISVDNIQLCIKGTVYHLPKFCLGDVGGCKGNDIRHMWRE